MVPPQRVDGDQDDRSALARWRTARMPAGARTQPQAAGQGGEDQGGEARESRAPHEGRNLPRSTLTGGGCLLTTTVQPDQCGGRSGHGGGPPRLRLVGTTRPDPGRESAAISAASPGVEPGWRSAELLKGTAVLRPPGITMRLGASPDLRVCFPTCTRGRPAHGQPTRREPERIRQSGLHRPTHVRVGSGSGRRRSGRCRSPPGPRGRGTSTGRRPLRRLPGWDRPRPGSGR